MNFVNGMTGHHPSSNAPTRAAAEEGRAAPSGLPDSPERLDSADRTEPVERSDRNESAAFDTKDPDERAVSPDPRETRAPAPGTPVTPANSLLTIALEMIAASQESETVGAAPASDTTSAALRAAVADPSSRSLALAETRSASTGSAGNESGDRASGAIDADRGAASAHRADNAAMRHVERGLQALLMQRGGTLIMRLSPPELGSLEIRMTFETGRVDLVFRGSGAEACRLLEGNLGMLRQSLERHGVGVGRLVVEPADFRRAEEPARAGVGESFDAGGRESQGRQEAERELRWRTDLGLAASLGTRPVIGRAVASEGQDPWPSSHPAPPSRTHSPAATAS